jgi:hypothetical protein
MTTPLATLDTASKGHHSGGHSVSMSGNFLSGQAAFETYYDTENKVMAADASLIQTINEDNANATTQFEQQMNSSTGTNNYIYQLTTGKFANGQTASTVTELYTDANQQLNAANTTRTGESQMFQNNVSGQPQNQQLLWTTLSSGRQVVDTLSSLVGSWIKG